MLDHVILHATPTHMDDSCDTIHDGRAMPKLVAITTQTMPISKQRITLSHLLVHRDYRTPPNSYETLRQSNCIPQSMITNSMLPYYYIRTNLKFHELCFRENILEYYH